ncbi:MAG: YlxR family protein [Fusicatenibacter sp.]|nr:YlxR family protein [Lachnospiraceae bacterium]MDY2937020.1 YlxR family protein [Fusicatenibacter sp.]
MSTVRKVPLRKCTGCGEMKSKKEMIRVVKTTEGPIVLDRTGKQNGRGAYVCSLECLEKAVKNKGLSRSLKTEIPGEVYESLKEAFAKLEQSK